MTSMAGVRPEIDALARAWLEQVETPFAIVDHDLKLHWANRSAEIEIERGSAIEARDDLLVGVDAACHIGLQQFVRSARRVLSTCCFPCDGGHLLVRGTEIHRNHLNRYVGLWFISTANFRPVYADLDVAFELTEREHRILNALIDSQRPEEIAQHLGLRLPTVRTHIRNLYDKLDVTCREELFRRVSPFRIT